MIARIFSVAAAPLLFLTAAMAAAQSAAPASNAPPPPPPAPLITSGQGQQQSAASGKSVKEDIDTLAAKIEAGQKDALDREKKIVKKIYDIQEILASFRKSEKSTHGENSLGRIELLELKAQRYSIERQARTTLEREVETLVTMVNDWETCKRRIVENKDMLALKKQIADLESNTMSAASQSLLLDKKSIEYYEVKKDSSLRDISALPDVYGNASNWKVLFDANRDKITDPAKPVPAGTVLTVPQLKTESTFDDFK